VKRNAQTVHNDAQFEAGSFDSSIWRRVENNFLKEVNKHHAGRGISDAKRAAASQILRAKPMDPILGIGTNSLNYQN